VSSPKRLLMFFALAAILFVGTAATSEARVKLRTAIGDLYAGKLESPSDALEFLSANSTCPVVGSTRE